MQHALIMLTRYATIYNMYTIAHKVSSSLAVDYDVLIELALDT